MIDVQKFSKEVVDTLSCNTQTGTVHQSHHGLNQTETGVTAKLCLGILVNQLAGRRTVNTQLVLDVTNGYATITLVVDKHRKTTTILGAFFRTSQNQVDI